MKPEIKVDRCGNKTWYLDGLRHREGGPAVERLDGTKIWYIAGELHREDGPAAEYLDGHKEWWLAGNLHRVDGPAVEWVNGYKEWWLNGRRFKSKESWFKSLKKNDKEKFLFSEHFIKE